MAWRGPVLAVVLLAMGIVLMLFGDRLPTQSKEAAPTIHDRIIVHQEPLGLQAINAAAGIGPQMVLEGQNLWITYTLSGPGGSSLWVIHSSDAGATFHPAVEASALLERRRVMHSALARGVDGTLYLAGVKIDEDRAPGSTSTTAIVLLRSADDGVTWEVSATRETSDAQQSLSAPYPLATPDGGVIVLVQETLERSRDAIRCWRALPVGGSDELLPVDDDDTGAPKGSYSAVLSGERVHVAYTDGRLQPGNGLFLYTTSAPLDTLAFAPSRLLDVPQERFWQAEPAMTVAPDGTLRITATQAVARFQSAAWRDKLQRNKVGGLHEVSAWSREPVVWSSTNDGTTWEAVGEWNDHTSEVRASAVIAVVDGVSTHLVWMENRPVTQDPDIRLVTRRESDGTPTASGVINDAGLTRGVEPLLGALLDPAGRLLVLYRESLNGQPEPQQLILARTAPLE